MRKIRQPARYSYVFSPYLEPLARVNPGETVAIYTKDAFEDRITKPDDVPSEILGSYLNPQTGPICEKGRAWRFPCGSSHRYRAHPRLGSKPVHSIFRRADLDQNDPHVTGPLAGAGLALPPA